jgi:hypothetical protein
MMENCKICNKKILKHFINIYKCKCYNIYCSEHKLNHNCPYDYHLNYKKIIKEKLPIVTSIKVDII